MATFRAVSTVVTIGSLHYNKVVINRKKCTIAKIMIILASFRGRRIYYILEIFIIVTDDVNGPKIHFEMYM